ncbi:Nucleolar protein 9 [Orchesella cincta]|uniref:Nucleolar protein 9 n=1 Tax=Orchesella cincta TaxID=48709 RepID=A0A1D2N1T5_ORCCI|nr:Nucleolar protein 9 [Orchesella cincta]
MPEVSMEESSFEKISKSKAANNKPPQASSQQGGGGDQNKRERRGRFPGGNRSFLKRAKRFEKQGKFGRGHEVDSETYGYFVRILDVLRQNEFETDEEREAFAENSLSQTEGTEVQLSSNQLVSRVIENILPLASEKSIFRICQAFTPSLRVVVCDPYASHVLEKLLEVTSSDKWIGSDDLTTWFQNTAKYVLNNFEDFTFDTYGSFVMKKALECLSGFLPPPDPREATVFGKNKKIQEALYGKRKTNPKRESMLKDFASRFAAWPQFNDLIQQPITSRLLQNVIETVNRTEGSDEMVKQLIVRVVSVVPETLEVQSVEHRLLEVCLSVATPKRYKIIFDKFYKGRLANYAVGQCLTLQNIISSAPNEETFFTVFDELSESFTMLINGGKAGVIKALTDQCLKFNDKQKELWNLLKSNINTDTDNSNLVMAIITMKEVNDDENSEQLQMNPKFSSSYFGTIIVEHLLDFEKPSGVLKSFNELEISQLKTLAFDPKASFVITKIFKSENVPQKQKIKLLHKMKEIFVELANTKFGSRILDSIWEWSDMSQKVTVAEVLGERLPSLSANRYGKFLVENWGLYAFKKDRKEWTEHMNSKNKRKTAALAIAAEFGLDIGTTPSNNETSEIKKDKKKKKRKLDQDDEETVESEPIVEATVEEETTESEIPKKKKKKKKSKELE